MIKSKQFAHSQDISTSKTQDKPPSWLHFMSSFFFFFFFDGCFLECITSGFRQEPTLTHTHTQDMREVWKRSEKSFWGCAVKKNWGGHRRPPTPELKEILQSNRADYRQELRICVNFCANMSTSDEADGLRPRYGCEYTLLPCWGFYTHTCLHAFWDAFSRSHKKQPSFQFLGAR